MRRIKFKLTAIVFCLLFFVVCRAYAVECVDLDDNTINLQTVLDDYTNGEYAEAIGNKAYQICFSGEKKNYQSTITISTHTGERLLLKNLSVSASAGFSVNTPLVLVANAGIIIDGATLTGNEKNIAVRFSNGGKIINSTMTQFAEGIRIAAGASVAMDKNSFVDMSNFNKLLIFEDAATILPIDKEKIGKYIENGKVSYIAGQMNFGEGLCEGSIKMYKREFNTISEASQANCYIDKVGEEEFVFDGTDKKLETGVCYFKCEDINLTPEIKVGFTYLNVNGFVAAPFMPDPTKMMSELCDVAPESYSGAAPLSLPGTGSEMGGEIVPTEPGPEDPNGAGLGPGPDPDPDPDPDPNPDPPDPEFKGQTSGNEQIDGSGASGSRLCTLVADAQYSPGSLMFFVWLLGLVPVTLRRIF